MARILVVDDEVEIADAHLLVALLGAIVFAGLARAASTPRLPVLWTAPSLGRIEVVAALSVFALILAIFVAARLVDPDFIAEQRSSG